MRLFVALPLPEDIIQALVKLRETIRGVKWQQPGQMHLTLRFLGDTPKDQLSKLSNELDIIIMESFSIQIDHLGVFPDRHSPRVIWAGLKQSKPLMNLQEMVEERCQSAGFKTEKRSFKPHVTLGRVKKASKRQVISFLESEKSSSLSLQTRISQFNLYRSELKSDGAVHQVVEKYLLEE